MFFKKTKKGFLLLELLMAAIILCTVGVAITKNFSKEIELTTISYQYQTAVSLCTEKMFDITLELKKSFDEEELKEFENQSGEFTNSVFQWSSSLIPFEEGSKVFLLTVSVTGLKGDRYYNLNQLIRVNVKQSEIMDEEEMNSDEF
jgi:hypothetical protein